MEDTQYLSHAIFWVDVDKISPNPFQPRKEFSESALASLAESIRQYGVLQPLVVTRKEDIKDDGGIVVTYELIAGERRLRAAKIASLSQVPVLIRDKEDNDRAKLEVAIIENIQREDLNPVDRAKAFVTLASDFGMTHSEIAGKVGKSREYVSNSIRIVGLPEEMLEAISKGRITEGHSRPLLMLSDRPQEQITLFRDITNRGLTVRDAEYISRRIATDKVRKPDRIFDRETAELEGHLAERLGTRVRIERKEGGGKIMIDFFSPDDLNNILRVIEGMEQEIKELADSKKKNEDARADDPQNLQAGKESPDHGDEELYSIKNFSI